MHRERYNDRPVQLRKDIVHHKTGWYCHVNVNVNGYYIEPQVELSPQDGIPIATQAESPRTFAAPLHPIHNARA